MLGGCSLLKVWNSPGSCRGVDESTVYNRIVYIKEKEMKRYGQEQSICEYVKWYVNLYWN